MTFVSVAEAACHLGIDVKTLRRWLCDAQLSLQCHPHDGRKKGMSLEHLQVLARLHQRCLAPLFQEPPAPVKSEVPPLPAELLALPEQLSALQTQIAALQQQVADLTRLVTQHEPASTCQEALGQAEQDSQASTQVCALCSPLSSCCQAAQQAGFCHPSR